MSDGIYIDTDLISDAYNDTKKAYKLLTTNNILDIASSLEKMEIIKELSSYKYLKNLKSEIDELITKAETAKDKCKNLTLSSTKAADFSGFSFSGLENMKILTDAIYQKSTTTETKTTTDTKKQEDEVEQIIENNNPNYNNNLDAYMESIKKDLGLEQLEKEMNIKISTAEELSSILKLLKEKYANDKTEKAQLESVIRQLDRYSKIDEFEKKYTTQSGYSGNEQLSDTTKIEQKQENIPQIEGTSSIEKAYIEYQSFKNYLSENQQHIMAYIYKTEGEAKAYEYYQLLQDQINQLKGMEKAVNEYEKIKEAGKKAGSTTTTSSYENIFGGSSYGSEANYYNAKKKSQEYMTEYMHSTIKGTVNGVEGFKESWENINNSNATELDYERMYLIEALQNDKDLASGLEETYGFGESVGNMLPTVTAGTIISVATGGAGAPVAAKLLQTAVTSSMIFGSSYTSKKHQNLLSGYTEEDAKKSAVVSAFSETLLEEALGSLPGVGNKSTNVLLNMFKEGGQEAIQQFAERLGDKWILDQDMEGWLDDSAKAFIYGALISATFEAGQTVIYNGVKVVINEKTLNKLKVAVNKKNEKEVQQILMSLPNQATNIEEQIRQLDKQYANDYNSFINGLNEAIKQTMITKNIDPKDYYKYTDIVLDEIKQGNYTRITTKNGWRNYIQSLYTHLCNRSNEYVSKKERLINQQSKIEVDKQKQMEKLEKEFPIVGIENRDYDGKKLEFYKMIGANSNIPIYVQTDVNNGNSDVSYHDIDILETIIEIEKYDKKLLKNVKGIYITDIVSPTDTYFSSLYKREFCSTATANVITGEIDVFKYSTKSSIKETMYHEIAHTFDRNHKVSNSRKWKKAAKKDGNFPSTYAKDSYEVRNNGRYSEDFADSIKELRKLGFKEFSKKYPNRATVLKEKLPDLCNNVK